MKQILTELEGKRDSSTRTVGDFKSLLSIMDRTSKQEINKETEDLNNIKNQLNLTDIHRKLHSTAAEYIFLSAPWSLNFESTVSVCSFFFNF